MKETYYIYQVTKNRKIGVARGRHNLSNRLRQSGTSIRKKDEYNILETHQCHIKVSLREIELQRQYGYREDKVLYFETQKYASKGGVIGNKNKRPHKSWKHL